MEGEMQAGQQQGATPGEAPQGAVTPQPVQFTTSLAQMAGPDGSPIAVLRFDTPCGSTILFAPPDYVDQLGDLFKQHAAKLRGRPHVAPSGLIIPTR
jgi:hypothetical protein